MRQFIDEHFNVIVLVVLLIIGWALFIHVIHHTSDSPVLNWLEHQSDQVLAALLGMMVGRATVIRADGPTITNGINVPGKG